MNLSFDMSVAESYKSGAQIARVLTENWVDTNMYCPRCGNQHIKHLKNNLPVADFICPSCNNVYELKSKNGNLGHKITDGAYNTMIRRITSNDNPDFLFMSYSKRELKLIDLILVPKHFFIPDIIEKRNPLPQTAQRAGWIGCNILIDKIPKQGRIVIISNGEIESKNIVINNLENSNSLYKKDLNSRGWLMDVLNCVNKTPSKIFTLEEIYRHVDELSIKHPKNHNIEAKIRQQLQLLRDKGFIEFLGNGNYRKID